MLLNTSNKGLIKIFNKICVLVMQLYIAANDQFTYVLITISK